MPPARAIALTRPWDFAESSPGSRIGQDRLGGFFGRRHGAAPDQRHRRVFRPGVVDSYGRVMSASALPDPAVRVYDTCKPVACGRRSGRRFLVRRGGDPGLTEQLIGQLGYLGIALILILGGLGLPIPEEAPIILAAVLTRNGQMRVPLALASCLAGVLLGDLVVYFLGFFYGEKVLSLPLTRRLLTRQREAQIKGYFHRHGFKILVSGRFVPGFRTAAYLTAGILKLPTLKLIMIDVVAASLTTFLMFGLGYCFAHQIQKRHPGGPAVGHGDRRGGTGNWLLVRYDRARRRSGLPVGPPVLDSDDVPLPDGDRSGVSTSPEAGTPIGVAEAADADRVGTLGPVSHDPPGREHAASRESAAPSVLHAHDPVIIELDGGQPPSVIERAAGSAAMESPARPNA